LYILCGRAHIVVEFYPLGTADAAHKIALIASLDSIDVVAAAVRAVAHSSTPVSNRWFF
jgi:hypothetical protein